MFLSLSYEFTLFPILTHGWHIYGLIAYYGIFSQFCHWDYGQMNCEMPAL